MRQLDRRTFLSALAAGAAGCALPRSARTAENKPNIVFIMADDLGYGDVRCYNSASKIPTPNIDRLAREGMRFTDAHAPASVCVPTRYGLMTGRYPFRMAGEKAKTESLIAPGRLTLGGLLQRNGYATACLGKWHLGIGGKNPDYAKPMRGGPVDRGFDYYFGIPRSLDQPPYYYIEDDRCVEAPTDQIGDSHSEGVSRIQGAFWRKGGIAPGFSHAKVLPDLTDKATEYLDGRAKEGGGKPFFLYLALPAPHTPWVPAKAFRGKSKAGDYGDYVAQVDATVGRVLERLDRHGFAEKTLIFFTSDNGPVWYEVDVARYGHDSTHPLRGMKGDAYEGGHRMPFLARWPGRVKAGSVSGEMVCHTDMLATCAAIVGDSLPADAGEDSYDILPALTGRSGGRPIRETLISTIGSRPLAIRQGPWKLIAQLGSGGFSQPRKEEPKPGGPKGQLYNLDRDLGETENLWLEHPEKVKELTTLLERINNNGRSTPRP